ncbi:MAG: UDP-N-acetylmuramoyl-tripeptide--D-alanyl-D-alanine ligase [Gammaproteobacteria bacterium]|nr:UDP-N-acetylmuramoyl-tripeptide--D-alanyl-D-alanine ligase [Gammaproteobacteria bacterium]
MHLAQVARAVNGELRGVDVPLRGVATDTRADCDGRLFVALRGDNFDAHDFVVQAQHKGAAAAMLERGIDIQIPTVRVADTRQALMDLAAWWRAQFVIPVVGVTGSVGKTSVKEMLGRIFAEVGNGLVTHGNLNNEIGVPLTLLRLVEGDQYAIVEMGMNHAGEISRLSNITKPTIALINNAAAAHLEDLGTVEAVARAKGEIFEGLSDDGVAVINADDKFASMWRDLAGDRCIITFGLQQADITGSYELMPQSVRLDVVAKGKRLQVEMPVIGEHNVRNALAAIAVASAANIPPKLIRRGLELYRPIGGRLTLHQFETATVLDDTYNANPASMQAAVDALVRYDNCTLIVGDMAELGDAAESAHLELGKYARDKGVDRLMACGEFSQLVAQGFGDNARAFKAQIDLIEELQQLGTPKGAILVKGSRSARMERVVKMLMQILQNNTEVKNAC